MATKHSLVILTPNGRRHTVNVTPNTSILKILEEVCEKHELDVNEWDLKHYNRTIELTNSIRFSGLPNNASLEMVQSTKPRKETTITLVLQLESGKRLKSEFFSSASLWDILTHWQLNGEQEVFPTIHNPSLDQAGMEDILPVCIYMRQEIIGEVQLKKTTLRSLGLTNGTACIRLVHRSENQLKFQANVSAPLSRQTTSDQIFTEESKLEPRAEATNQSQSVVSNESVNSEQEVLSTSKLEEEPMQLGEASVQQIFVNPEEPSSAAARTYEEYDSIPITPKVKLAPEGQLHILGDHDACFYYSGDVDRVSNTPVDDSFFDLTQQDIRKMQRDLVAKRKELEEAPLRISAVRALEKETAKERILKEHPLTVVKIRFPNRYVLQGIFPTDSTIASIAHFVQHYLADPNFSFYLLITPPRTRLANDAKLIDLNLVSNVVMYFGAESIASSGTVDYIQQDIYAKLSSPNAIQEYVHNKVQASETRIESESIEPIHSPFENRATSNQENQDSSNHASSSVRPNSTVVQPSKRAAQNSGVVPKWFKK